MDTVTHALVGAMTARACVKSGSDKRLGRTLLLAAAFSAAFPDIDYLLFWVNPYRFIAEWHRGITHSLLMLPVWAALLSAGAFFLANKRIAFGTLFGFCSLGLSAHIATDLITIYGIQLFSPLSDRRFALSLTFDLDPWLGL
ncbi:MAG: metal-dependent hydrolase, partial [Gammaproteobacteria bacterium]